MESFCTAGGLSTLTDQLVGKVKSLDHKTIRWPGHANQMQFLLGLGFGEDRNIDVRTHLTYRDVLVRRMRQRLGGPHEDAVLLRVLLKGKVGRKKRTLVYELLDSYDASRGMTAIQRCTSVPTATIAQLIAAREIPGGGASPPENIIPRERFLEILTERDMDISTRWYDGYVDVGNPDAKPA